MQESLLGRGRGAEPDLRFRKPLEISKYEPGYKILGTVLGVLTIASLGLVLQY